MTSGRKAESIYTAVKRMIQEEAKRQIVSARALGDCSFEERLRGIAATKACYAYINGISMPVLTM